MKLPFARHFSSLSVSPFRTKITLLFIALMATPILLLGYSAMYLIQSAHHNDVSALELQLIGQKEAEINKYFADTLGVLELQVAFTQDSDISLSDQKFLLDGMMQSNKAFEEVAFLTRSGMETSKIMRDEASSTELLDRSLEPYTASILSGSDYIGPIYQTLRGPMVTIGAPVRNQNGDIIQALVAEVNLSSLSASIDISRLGTEGYIILIDEQGRIVAGGPDQSYRGELVSGAPQVASLQKTGMLPEEQKYYRSFLTGLPVIADGAVMQPSHWIVYAEWPIDDANQILNDVRMQILLLTILCIAAGVVLAPLFARRITRPIELLRNDAAKVAEGNLDGTLSIATGDELEYLAASFSKMKEGLRQLEELRGEFTHVISHELRAPVTSIRGYVSMLREGEAGELPETARTYIDRVWQSADHLAILINDLLDVAKMEAGKFTVEMTAVDISAVTREVVDELAPLSRERGISVSYEPNGIPNVTADRTRLKQVAVNILSNAVKYSAADQPVRIEQRVENGTVVTSIINVGAGISLDEQQNVFQKYFRAKSHAKIIGTGLGLYIVKQLVERMGGTISFKSEPGKETSFTFVFPARTLPVSEAAK